MRPRLYLRYLLLPARSAPLLMIVCFSIGLTLAAWGGLLGLPLALILLAWLFKYAFVMFDAASRGVAEPPVLSIEMTNPVSELRPLGALLIVGVYYGATALLGEALGDSLVTVLRVAGLAILPASVAILGSTGNLIDAVNPVLLAQFIRRIGLDYVGLAAVIVGYVALVLLLPWHIVWTIVNLALLQFATLSLFSVMGGIFYERRHDLGFEAWHTPERLEERRTKEQDRAADREADEVYVHHRSGHDDAAWRSLQAVLEQHAHSLDTYHAMYRRIARWPDPRLANALARQMLPRLLQTRHPGDALLIVRDRLLANPEFRPETGAETLRLARLARSAGDAPMARLLLADFGMHFPADMRAIQYAMELADELQR